MVHVIPLIWNNQNTRINNRPVFYRRYFSSGILTVNYNLNNLESYGLFGKNIERSNILEWIGLCHSVPLDLRSPVFHRDLNTTNRSSKIGSGVFDASEKIAGDYYFLLVLKKGRFPNYYTQALKRDFELTDESLEQIFLLPDLVAFEPYVKTFQYRVLNSVL